MREIDKNPKHFFNCDQMTLKAYFTPQKNYIYH